MSITRRDFLKFGGAALLTAAMGKFRPQPSPPQEQAILWQGSPRYPRVALTYDDCYSIDKLQHLEAILAQNLGVQVTLFPVGTTLYSNEEKDKGIWKRFHKNGHEIGYHSFDHINPEVVSTENELADFDKWMQALQDVLDIEPVVRFARPPFGNTSPSFLNMCAQRGQVPTMWSTGWGGGTEDVVNYTVPKIRNGDIVLLHTRAEDIATTEEALPELAERGIQAVTMSRLYLDLLKEQNESEGCETAAPPSLTQTCIE